MTNRPSIWDFPDYSTTDAQMKALSNADNKWIAGIEHYYVSPQLQTELEWKSGWGSKTKNVESVFKGVDFDIQKINNITLNHKIARGAEDQILKNIEIAIPI